MALLYGSCELRRGLRAKRKHKEDNKNKRAIYV